MLAGNNTKKIVLIVIFALLYLWWFIHGYIIAGVGGWMFATALLYILMHYVTLSWRETVQEYTWVAWIFMLGVSIFVGVLTHSAWMWASALFWHGALWFVIDSLEDSLINRRRFKSIDFFTTGGVLFSILFTLSFITSFIGRNPHFNLTCNEINDASTSVVSYTKETVSISVEAINNAKNALIHYIIPSTGNTDSTESGSNYDPSSIMWLIQMYKQQLIDSTISNQKNVSLKVCQVFVDQINDLYDKPWFRFSVIVLMFLFISPLLRITLYIITVLNLIIFKILKRYGVFVIIKENAEVDKII